MTTDTIAPDVDISQVTEKGNALLKELDTLREAEPIHWNETTRSWIVTRYADIHTALKGDFPLSAVRFRPEMAEPLMGAPWQDSIPTIGHFVSKWVTNLDGSAHARLRLLASRAFRRTIVEGIRPYVQGRIAELMEIIATRDKIEFVEDIARELPGHVILRLIGLSDDLYPELREWARKITTAFATAAPRREDFENVERALIDMTNTFKAVIADRRKAAPYEGDFIGLLLAANEDGDRLTEDEMIGMLQLAIFAGHDTTSNSMTLGIETLARNPSQWRYWQNNPKTIAATLPELMRFSAMSTAQNRVAEQDYIWHGKQIKAGDLVYLMFAAGNRDPRAFPKPEELDFTSDARKSLVFGPGLHQCIGQQLALMQLTEFFTALVHRFDGADLLDPQPTFLPALLFRGYGELNMRFRRASTRNST